MSPTVDLRVGRRRIEVKRAEKELFPRDGITKADLAEHYRRVAPRMLPELRGRPLMLERMPDGIEETASTRRRSPTTSPTGSIAPRWPRRAAR